MFSPGYRSDKLHASGELFRKLFFSIIGRISAEKDLNILVESYNKVNEKFSRQIMLVITGEGPFMRKCKSFLPADTVFTGLKKRHRTVSDLCFKRYVHLQKCD